MKAALILLAGGKGTRMGAAVPKQFLPLKSLPVVLHSLQVFDQVAHIQQSIIVTPSEFQHLFRGRTMAPPGPRRQDSVWNGLQALEGAIDLVCIHDAARPFITVEMVERVLEAGMRVGAAAVGMPLKYTVKEVDPSQQVKKTLDRSHIWEIQTPQVVKKELLARGFQLAFEKNLTVTDDVSLVELLHHPVQLVEGSYQNFKLTTMEDMYFARWRHDL